MAYPLQQRLDACAKGEFSPGVFALELSALCRSRPDCAWDVLSLVDQYYRRGKLSADGYRTISHTLERQVLGLRGAATLTERPRGSAAAPLAAASAPASAAAAPAGPAIVDRPPTPKPGESAAELLALQAQLRAAQATVQRYRHRIAILSGFARDQRSALAEARRELQLAQTRAQGISRNCAPASAAAARARAPRTHGMALAVRRGGSAGGVGPRPLRRWRPSCCVLERHPRIGRCPRRSMRQPARCPLRGRRSCRRSRGRHRRCLHGSR